MWVLKLKLMHKDCHIVPRCKKYRVITHAFPFGVSGGVHKEDGKTFLTAIHYIYGGEKAKASFFDDLKSDRRLRKLEISGNRFSYILQLPKGGEHVQLYYSTDLIFLKPIINHHDGFEYWEVGSWDRKVIISFLEKLKSHMDYYKVLKLSKSKLVDVYFPMLFPKIPEKQKKAIELAHKRGYYSYPKKIELRDLAKESGVSTPTFQENLRKAEIKLLPFILEQNI